MTYYSMISPKHGDRVTRTQLLLQYSNRIATYSSVYKIVLKIIIVRRMRNVCKRCSCWLQGTCTWAILVRTCTHMYTTCIGSALSGRVTILRADLSCSRRAESTGMRGVAQNILVLAGTFSLGRARLGWLVSCRSKNQIGAGYRVDRLSPKKTRENDQK